MDELWRQVGRAQRRLITGRFLASLAMGWSLGLLVAAGWIAIRRLLLHNSAGLNGSDGAWIAGSLVIGFLAAAVWAWWTAPSRMAAAMEIDRRFHLEQRVSSALALPPGAEGTAAAEALVRDAAHAVGKVTVAEEFPVGHIRGWWLTMVAGVATLVVLLAIPSAQQEIEPGPEEIAEASPVVRPWSEAFEQELVVQARFADQRGMRATAALFKDLQGEARLLATESRREQTLSKLNDLARQLEDRRGQLAGVREFQPQLEPFGAVRTGPAAPLAKSLQRSDFARATGELEKLAADLAARKFDGSQRDTLAKNLEKIQEAARGVNAASKAEEAELKQRAADLRRAGQNDQAATLEKRWEHLAEQTAALHPLEELAKKIGQSLSSMREGDADGAAEMLGRARADLQRLQEHSDEIRMLDNALNQIAQLRRQMNCNACGGKGCAECQAEKADEAHTEGSRFAREGSQAGGQDGRLGGEKTNIKGQFFDARVAPKASRDARAGSISGTIDGPNTAGASHRPAQEPSGAVGRGTTDPLSGRHLPWKEANHAREYFERFRAER